MPYANNNGVKIHYEVEGSGPPLILQHGFSDSLESWYDLGYVEALKRNYGLILVDARGHGESDKPHDTGYYRPEITASDYVKILDDLNIQKVHYWGYSMGVQYFLSCIVEYASSRICSVIMGGGIPYELKQTKTEEDETHKFSHPMLDMVEKGPEAWVALIEQGGVKLPDKTRACWLRNDLKALLASQRAAWEWQRRDSLPRIDVPCLVYVGEADGSFRKANEAVKVMSESTFISIPGLNHIQGYLRSDLVLPHVKKFLAEVDRK